MKQNFKMFFTGLALFILLFGTSEIFAQGISINLGKNLPGRYMRLVANGAGEDGEIKDAIRLGTEYCSENVKSAMYFQLDESFFYQLTTNKFFIVNVEYYDEPGVEIKLVYDAIGDANANKEYGTAIQTTGTNQWKSFGFYLDDAYFGHRQAHGADFRLVTNGKMHINGLSLVPIDYYFEWGSVNDSLGLNMTERPGKDSQRQIVVKDGEEAVTTLVQDNYLYIDVADSLIYGTDPALAHPNLFVSVQYWDEDPTNKIRLQYDATTNAYKSTPWVYAKGWKSWRTVTFELNDAQFTGRENGKADMRLQINLPNTIAVNRIMVGLLPKAPLPPIPDPGVFASYKALEPPTIDGDLKDWAWQKVGSKLETKTDALGFRTDEFYRTWVLDGKNVPVAETGEPGVTDPGKPGLWDPKDLSGEVKCFWDDLNFYVSANITDNVVNVNGSTWEGKDGIGLYVDVFHNIVGGKPIPERDDATYGKGENFIFLPADEAAAGLWKHSTSQTGEALPNTIIRKVKKTETGYVIEASIPLDLIKDGVTLNPGVYNDQDNFNPLFGYTINDADGIAENSGRLSFGAPNDDDEAWGTLSLEPIPLVDKGIIMDFGQKNFEQFITQVEKTGDGAVDIISKGEKSCALLKNKYAYLAVSDDVIKNGYHPHLFIQLEYFDEPTTGKFRVQYDGNTKAYTSTPWISHTGTGTWKTAIFEIRDAKFNNGENGGADFRIESDEMNMILNQVKVGIADYYINRGDSTSYMVSAADAQSDGITKSVFVGGKWCSQNSIVDGTGGRYFYHAIADTVMYQGKPSKEVFVTIEYYDTLSSGGVALNYQATNNTWANGAGDAMILGTNQWKMHTFYLPDAYFANGENGGHDFRVSGKGDNATFIKHVMIGVLGLDSALIVGVRDPKGPNVYALDQNYPNPFNPSTTIRYQLPESGIVTLKVLNILGQEVATLVNTFQTPGMHSVNFNAEKLSSGMYIYTIHFNNKVISKKLMLLK
ncbi:MAG: T9SS type A sorting domain-containing protein [Ignavibacteria bacterium]|jgi:hypothetical protein|nr:T9SS type A sorting domain-containing protein [Ignavibacteria bacterium]